MLDLLALSFFAKIVAPIGALTCLLRVHALVFCCAFEFGDVVAADAIKVEARYESHTVECPADIGAVSKPFVKLTLQPRKQPPSIGIACVAHGRGPRFDRLGYLEELRQRRLSICRQDPDLESGLNRILAPRANRSGRRDDRSGSEHIHTSTRMTSLRNLVTRVDVKVQPVARSPDTASSERANIHSAIAQPSPARRCPAMIVDVDHGIPIRDHEHGARVKRH